MLLTGVNLLLRFVGTSFQIYISNIIGASGVGLLQLVMSVGSLAMIAGMAGIRTTSMYLTAEELGKHQKGNIRWVLSACYLYSIVCSGLIGCILYLAAPWIAQHWIGDPGTVIGLRIFGACLPLTCLCGVMTGYFTAANKIRILAAIEVLEQLISMGITIILLHFWSNTNSARACACIILGSAVGTAITLVLLVTIHLWDNLPRKSAIPIRKRLLYTAIPLALADVLKAGINTAENLMVPKRLDKNPQITDPLAAFGTVAGMVFPIVMFPACILFGLAELLIPELARCSAAENEARIIYLVKRSLKITLLYSVVFSGLIYLLADDLCQLFYKNISASSYLKLYALLIPMLYCDTITDAMTKGLGQQTACVRYNILTSAMDVIFLFFLLPRYGMGGYYFSFALTHMVNFILSLQRLLKITGIELPLHFPAIVLGSAGAAAAAVSSLRLPFFRMVAFPALLFSLWVLFQILRQEDYLWLKNLIFPQKRKPAV